MTRKFRVTASYIIISVALAWGAFGIIFESRVLHDPSLLTPAGDHPYEVAIKGITLFLNERDYWIATLWLYIFLLPFVALIFVYWNADPDEKGGWH